MARPVERPPIYGLMAEFENPTDLVHAARATYAAGYRRINGYSPFSIEELSEAIGFHHTRLPLVVLIGGLLGCIGGYGLQYWISVVSYPENIGGRPLHSWPAFIPVTFECTVLLASFAAVFGMLALNGLPMPYHPVFNVERFAFASRDRFFLVVESRDPLFDRVKTADFLASLNPKGVMEVPH
jgi:ActD protein